MLTYSRSDPGRPGLHADAAIRLVRVFRRRSTAAVREGWQRLVVGAMAIGLLVGARLADLASRPHRMSRG
jgi:hypothetical protein